MNEPYLLDDEPVTAQKLIHAASKLDHSFACACQRPQGTNDLRGRSLVI